MATSGRIHYRKTIYCISNSCWKNINHSGFKWDGMPSSHSNCCSFSVHQSLINFLTCRVIEIVKPRGSYILFICDRIIRFDSTTGEEFETCSSRKLSHSRQEKSNVTENWNEQLLQDQFISSTFPFVCFKSCWLDECHSYFADFFWIGYSRKASQLPEPSYDKIFHLWS